MKPGIKIDQLVRSHRTTISLIVDKNGSLIVRAPIRASEKEIYRLLETKREWIERKQHEVRNRRALNPEKTFSNGEMYFFKGKQYPLKIVKNSHYSLEFTDNVFHLSEDVRKYGSEVFESFYKQNAKSYIVPRAMEIAEQLGINYQNIKISSAKKRWGSCSSAGNINFSLRLIMAPEGVIDYVIVHEFAHLWEMNHSPRFWQIVEKMMPDYREPYRILKEFGHLWEL